MLGIERHNGFFPILRIAEPHLRASRLALAILRMHFQNLDFEQLFDRPLHIGLCCQAIDLKRVGIERVERCIPFSVTNGLKIT